MAQPFEPDEMDTLEPMDEMEEEVEEPEEASNRTFLLVAIGFGGLFVVGLICIGLYLFLVQPRQREARETQVAGINATNAQVQTDAANTANPPVALPTDTPFQIAVVTTEAPLATDTPVLGVAGDTLTPTITNTPGPSFTPSRTPTRIGGTPIAGAVTATPTRLVGATATRTPTTSAIGGGGETSTPTPTALPETGFADEVGVPGLFIAAFLLIAVLVAARRLRTQHG